MGGLFGGNKDPAPTPQPVTLPAPAASTPQADKNQAAAQTDALKRAQGASTLATDTSADPGKDDGTYNRTTLG